MVKRHPTIKRRLIESLTAAWNRGVTHVHLVKLSIQFRQSDYKQRLAQNILTQSALEFCPIHCPNGRLGQDLGFGGIAFALKLPEMLNRNLAVVRAKLGQTSCFPNGPQIWCPIGQ